MANGTKEALRGFCAARIWPVTANKKTEYATGAMIDLEGAQNLTRSETRQEMRVDADDGIYYQENELQYVDYQIQLAELPLSLEAALGGHTYDEATNSLKYSINDQANEVAFAYASLKLNNTYRMFKHYLVKLVEVSCDLTTRGESGDILPYTLTLRSQVRTADGAWGEVRDSTDTSYTWLDTIEQIQDETP